MDTTVHHATIQKMIEIEAPANPAAQRAKRYNPTEPQTYEINGKLTLIKREKDEDYHIVVSDDADLTMIGESPSPSCAAKSHF